jgi:hypothetical protein
VPVIGLPVKDLHKRVAQFAKDYQHIAVLHAKITLLG